MPFYPYGIGFLGIMMKRKKGFYSISAVAKMFSVHQQTIRLYEKQGLIAPKRSVGNTRLFADEDVDRLEQVIYLTHQLGINLAGVEMILKLQRKIKKMQKEMNAIFDDTQEDLKQEQTIAESAIKKQVKEVVRLKQKAVPHYEEIPEQETSSAKRHTFDVDNWQLEYED